MVIFRAAVVLIFWIFAGSGATRAEPPDEVGAALGKGAFPWYDASKDQVKPMSLPSDPTDPKAEASSASGSESSTRGSWGWTSTLGQMMAYAGFGLGLAALVGLLAWFWRLYEPIDSEEAARKASAQGEPSRVEALPPGLRREFESSDPWAEAVRRRDRGDLAGSVVCLFAHQLLTLSGLGLVRLAPGKTGRQLLRAVTDAEFRGLVHPTLRLFEVVYYGHRDPTSEEFASLWSQAEAFERRRVAGGLA